MKFTNYIVNNKYILFILISLIWILFCKHVFREAWLYFLLLVLGDIMFWRTIPWPIMNKKRKRKRSKIRGWLDALVFAVIAASIIRIFLIEAYTIPTPSMEGSLLVGDFLFVSKISYGPRVPITPIAFPLVHNKMPFSNKKSYIKNITYPYKRLKGFSKIKRNDCVVFNFPADSLGHPIDRKDNYVKRCVGLPGDILEIKNKNLFINNKLHEEPKGMEKQYLYDVKTKSALNTRTLEKMNLYSPKDYRRGAYQYLFWITEKEHDELISKFQNIRVTKRHTMPPGLNDMSIFPAKDTSLKWNQDNYGPIYIPIKGDTIIFGGEVINSKNISIYKEIIIRYEAYKPLKNSIKEDLSIKYPPKKGDTIIFTMNYYWMMGDNRDNSLDSRFWGFVPENHIVGKAVFIWMSIDKNNQGFNKIRWNRIFNAIK